MSHKPQFITLEGMDGAGKTTHMAFIQAYLRQQGIDFIATREPGGTPLGEALRALLLNTPMHAQTEALLMFAARAEHLAQVIRPALAQGRWVLSDRFTDASFAYQSGGRQMPAAQLEALEAWLHADLQPDLTILLDVPLETSMARLAANRTLDRFEQEKADFHARVRQAYLTRAAQNPKRFVVLDASGTIEAIQAQLVSVLQAVCTHA